MCIDQNYLIDPVKITTNGYICKHYQTVTQDYKGVNMNWSLAMIWSRPDLRMWKGKQSKLTMFKQRWQYYTSFELI